MHRVGTRWQFLSSQPGRASVHTANFPVHGEHRAENPSTLATLCINRINRVEDGEQQKNTKENAKQTACKTERRKSPITKTIQITDNEPVARMSYY